MPFVTAERWANRKWVAEVCDVVDGQATQRVRAWGFPLEKRLRMPIESHKPIDKGRQFVLGGPGNAVLDWYDGPDLAPFETVPGELKHLAEFGAHISRLRLEGPPTKLEMEHDLIVPPGVTFAYQAALTPAEIADGCRRAAAVVGSYAVYEPGGFSIAHIPRPLLIDKNGDKWWGTVEITWTGAAWRSRVTFPASLASEVAFPVMIYGLDTFGYTTVGGSTSGPSSDYIMGYGPHAAPADGTATHSGQYITGLSNTPVTLGIYGDSGSAPNALLKDSAGATENTDGWVDQALDSGLAITNGTSYWVGRNHDDDTLTVYYNTVAGKTVYYKASTYSHGALENPFPGGASTSVNRAHTVRITYTPAGGGKLLLRLHADGLFVGMPR